MHISASSELAHAAQLSDVGATLSSLLCSRVRN